mgnify:CR=1 FL=1
MIYFDAQFIVNKEGTAKHANGEMLISKHQIVSICEASEEDIQGLMLNVDDDGTGRNENSGHLHTILIDGREIYHRGTIHSMLSQPGVCDQKSELQDISDQVFKTHETLNEIGKLLGEWLGTVQRYRAEDVFAPPVC